MRRERPATPPRVWTPSARWPRGCPPARPSRPRSPAPAAARRVLDVPRYSQMIHRGHYPQYGGGGEAWCSPTSTSMVLGYYDALPARRDLLLGAATATPTPWVDHAARATYDDGVRRHRQLAVQHRLRRLRWTGDGVRDPAAPPARGRAVHRRRHPAGRLGLLRRAASSTAPRSPRPTATCWSIVGFTAAGDVVVNDPAASSSSGRAPHLRPRPVRGRLAARLRRPRLRHPRRRAPAAARGRAATAW